MQRYLMRRLVLAVPTLFGITLLIFLAMRVLPGDPLSALQGEGAIMVMSEEDIQAARHSLGLDRSLPEQYLSWMNDIAHLEFGHSFWRNEPIGGIIARRGPITAEIALMAIIISWLVGIPVGIVSAIWRNKWPDTVARLFVILFVAVPSFWIALLILLVMILGFTYRPPITIVYLWDDPWANLQMCLGPAFVLGITVAALTARMTRSATMEVLQEDYVRTARAKGLTESALVWRHVLRNALLPVVTVSGVALGGLLGGSVAVERAFLVPGLGTSLVTAVGERDWMMIQNLVLLYGVVFAAINLLIDMTYGWLDPRIRFDN
ncbi:MAG: ABC transporter permease [Chloroflexi bacterium]|nr:ABC transporter permease [Chloroflexota bacterium]MCL5108329.1 ABC transporter permease [Chloroflexota bacterium]MDA8218253.1 ABC transporter permease [Dehalococcoidales bacterium]